MSSISPEALMTMTAPRAMSMEFISSSSMPEWTPEDAALACRGLSQNRWAAFAYRWAGDDSMRRTLYACLFNAALEMAGNENWPTRVAGERYVERLVWLALAEEKHWVIGHFKVWPAFIRWPVECIRELSSPEVHILRILHRIKDIADEDEKLWHQVSRRYEGVRLILDTWCTDAHRYAAKRIGNYDEIDDDN